MNGVNLPPLSEELIWPLNCPPRLVFKTDLLQRPKVSHQAAQPTLLPHGETLGPNSIHPLRFLQPCCPFCFPPAHLNRQIKFNACFPILAFGLAKKATVTKTTRLRNAKHTTCFWSADKKRNALSHWGGKPEVFLSLFRELTRPSFLWKVSPSDKGSFLCLLIPADCMELVLKIHCRTVQSRPCQCPQIPLCLWIRTRLWRNSRNHVSLRHI